MAAAVYVSLWIFAGWEPLSVGSWFEEEDCPPGYYRDVVGEDRWRGEIYGCVPE